MTQSTKIANLVLKRLGMIRKGDPVPWLPAGSKERFAVTPAKVSAALSDIKQQDHLPAIVFTDAAVNYRPLLADVSLASMVVYVSGIVYDFENRQKESTDSVKLMRELADDVYTVMTCDPQWGGLARRTRLLSMTRSTEEEEQSQGFIYNLDIDFIEIREATEVPYRMEPLPMDGLPSKTEEVSNALFNALITADDIAYVERSDVWPLPLEKVTRSQTPGIWYRETIESWEYKGSRQADKRMMVAITHIVVETDHTAYLKAVDQALARIKNVIGNHADLSGRVLTVDLQTIRADRSEYPVVLVDADIVVRYVHSGLEG